MWKMLRSCLQSTLKIVNSILTMVGLAIILYSLWMLKEWNLEESVVRPGNNLVKTPFEGRPFGQHLSDDLPRPWFIYTFLGIGISLCLITCSGHIAAETANGHCLSCYMLFVCLLFIVEAGVAADIFLNKNWEEDFPEDPTGQFDELKKFVRDNFYICKWVGLIILIVQALSILLGLILRALGPDLGNDYESDDDYVPPRLDLRQPFLNRSAPTHCPT
uniref:TSA: Wollemia nobilis Ref_Wollemi_Transcript_9705_1427 transcribed RNA sequence n=1 Tax=Wollemia nobilis TaxID=56998 RepID=A0A0C9QU30_9CONI